MKKLFYLIFIVLFGALSFYAIHDLQTAQGLGVFFSNAASFDAVFFLNIIVDLGFFFFLALYIAIPLISTKNKTLEDVFHFMLLYLAFIPTTRPDDWLHFLQGTLEKDTVSFARNLMRIAEPFRFFLPALILCFGYYSIIKGKSAKKWHLSLLIISLLLLIIVLFSPELCFLCLFLSMYFGIILMFDLLKSSGFSSKAFTILLMFTSLYRIISATAHWTM